MCGAFAVKGKVDIMAEAPVITPVLLSGMVTLYLMLPPVDLSGQMLKVLVSGNKGTEEMKRKSSPPFMSRLDTA